MGHPVLVQEHNRGDEAADRGGGGDHVLREAVPQAGPLEGLRRHDGGTGGMSVTHMNS